jgi:hypothetical protein
MVDFVYSPPLSPSNRFIFSALFLLCLRGKEFERGRSPLSPELPSLAINICGFLISDSGWRGDKGVRLSPASQMQTEPAELPMVPKNGII